MAEVKTGKAILVCTVASLFCTYQFLLQGATSVMLPELMASLGLNLEQVGWVASAFLYMYLLCQVPAGVLADRCNGRWLLVGCCLLLGLACYWFARAEGFLEACLARTLMGLATAPAIVVCLSLVSRWFPEHLFPAVSGLVESMAVLGGALGPLLLPVLMEENSWRFALLILAGCGVILAAVILLVVRHQPSGKYIQDSFCKDNEQAFRLSVLLRNRQLWLCCCFGFGSFVVINTFASLWAIPFLEHRFPDGERLVHGSVALIFTGLALGAPAFGLLASVVGRCRLWMATSMLAQIGLAGIIFFTECQLHSVCVLCFLMGFCSGGYMLAFTMVRDVMPAAMLGLALALVNASMLLGGPVLQPVIGAWVQVLTQQGLSMTEAFRMTLPLLTSAQLLALVSVLMMKRRRQAA